MSEAPLYQVGAGPLSDPGAQPDLRFQTQVPSRPYSQAQGSVIPTVYQP